jgi:hypothetical protein
MAASRSHVMAGTGSAQGRLLVTIAIRPESSWLLRPW